MTTDPNALLQTIRQIVRQELRRVQGAAVAIVQEQHTAEYACTVMLRDTEIVLRQVPVATARMGMASIPAINDLVLLQFIGGDINQPVIVGSLYNDEDVPPDNADGQAICQLPLGASGAGIEIIANGLDTPSLVLRIGGNLELTLQDDDPAVNIDVGSGSAALTIDSDGTVAIKGGNGFSIEAGADLTLKGANVTLEGAGEVTVKGAVINLN